VKTILNVSLNREESFLLKTLKSFNRYFEDKTPAASSSPDNKYPFTAAAAVAGVPPPASSPSPKPADQARKQKEKGKGVAAEKGLAAAVKCEPTGGVLSIGGGNSGVVDGQQPQPQQPQAPLAVSSPYDYLQQQPASVEGVGDGR